MSKLIGYRTLIVNAILLAVGALRMRHPDKVPDDATVSGIINAVLDAVFSVPGAGIINIILRIITSTPVLKNTA